MRKFSLIAAVLVAGLGVATASTSAFAAVCLNPAAGTIDLSHNLMVTGQGYGVDYDGYRAEMAKGNRCPVTEQSVSNDQIQDLKPHGGGVSKNGMTSYN